MTLCPICNGTSFPLGQLGELMWYRCRGCGLEHHGDYEEDELSRIERENEDAEMAQHEETFDGI